MKDFNIIPPKDPQFRAAVHGATLDALREGLPRARTKAARRLIRQHIRYIEGGRKLNAIFRQLKEEKTHAE
jgi:hypothetical protein